MNASDTLLVLCNTPDTRTAHNLARLVVERRLAACVNVLAPCESVYRWQGKVETTHEIPLLIKTHATRYAELETALRTAHPYAVPEIIALPLAEGLPEYLAWIASESAPA